MKLPAQVSAIDWQGVLTIERDIQEKVQEQERKSLDGSATDEVDENNNAREAVVENKNCPGVHIRGIATPSNYDEMREYNRSSLQRYIKYGRDLLSFFRGVNEVNRETILKMRTKRTVRKKRKPNVYLPSDSETEY